MQVARSCLPRGHLLASEQARRNMDNAKKAAKDAAKEAASSMKAFFKPRKKFQGQGVRLGGGEPPVRAVLSCAASRPPACP